jgi:hypothetical protein
LSVLVEPTAKGGKRPSPNPARSAQTAGAKPQPDKKTIKTCLVASCGWPTDAELPARRSATRR